MNIPHEVKVGSMTYIVKQSDKTLVLNAKQCKGICDYDNHVIELDSSVQDLQGIEQTFLHELVHAIIRERGIVIDGTDEELEVDELAKGLHSVIVDNPGLFVPGEYINLIKNNPGGPLRMYDMNERYATESKGEWGKATDNCSCIPCND